MTVPEFLAILKECPLIASVQASPGSPLDDPETLLKLAKASLSQGVKVLRLQGVENIKRIKGETGVPVIGLIKRQYPDSEVYITPTIREVEELLETGCEVIALDGTERRRYRDESLQTLVKHSVSAGKIVLGDCDTVASLHYAQTCGCQIASTTLAGYTPDRAMTHGPDLPQLAMFLSQAEVPVVAEGRYDSDSHVIDALRLGAKAVVVGGALNDPFKQTARFKAAATAATSTRHGNVGAVDIGGTWIRFGLFSPDWKLLELRRVPRHDTNDERLSWIEETRAEFKVTRVGVSSGGVIDPTSGRVVSSKDSIPDNVGFSRLVKHKDTWYRAINDGLASSWGHAYVAEFFGLNVFTLAIGTGVGAGYTLAGKLLLGMAGDYLHVNDWRMEDGRTVEETIGGMYQPESPTEADNLCLEVSVARVVDRVFHSYQPDKVVLCGSIGSSPAILKMFESRDDVVSSPFGADAGLYGAAALALFPPVGVFPE